MPRFPHELRREGLFTHTWMLKGTVLSGRFQPPRGDRPGVYQSHTLRLEYHVVGRRLRVEFQSPFLSRDGDRVQGEVRLGHAQRVVQVANKGTGAEGVTLQLVHGGLLRRKMVLLAPHGAPIATVQRKSGHFDVDIPSGVFHAEPGDRAARGKARLYEAAIVMLLAARIEQEHRRRAAVAGAAAGAAAAGAAAGATARHRQRKRKDDDGPHP